MPCRYDSDDYARDTRAELDKLTRLLCEACTIGAPNSGKSAADYSDELKNWWAKHQKWDEHRREQEQEQLRRKKLYAKALSKLTDEEKELLGIKHE